MIEQIKNKHLLIDGDIYKYRCAASAEKTKYCVTWDSTVQLDAEFKLYDSYKEAKEDSELSPGTIWSRKEVQPLEFALQACKTAINTLLVRLEPSSVSIFLSPERTFRHDIARTRPYKGNRSQPKPKYLKEVEEYLIHEYGAKVGNNTEADDEIGIALSQGGGDTVAVSIDKDLLQIPGWHYNWVNDRIQWITPKEGDIRFYTQMLTGDATDNIPGLPGTGSAGARKILSGARSRIDLATRVWMCYRGEFTTTDAASTYYLEQANLLWILRHNPRLPGHSLGYFSPIVLK